jgi:hypothetical protein
MRRHHALAADEIVDRHVGGVVAVAMRHGEIAGRLAGRGLQKIVDGDTAPMRVELSTSRAQWMSVFQFGLRQRVEFLSSSIPLSAP